MYIYTVVFRVFLKYLLIVTAHFVTCSLIPPAVSMFVWLSHSGRLRGQLDASSLATALGMMASWGEAGPKGFRTAKAARF